ncbi:2-dehydropantoate 2-reductase [Cystobacter fuscus]|uniref:2-dehydropantoate 2-reductase n=1 Tax=Cystobacter fuscus TaxID=43 RepID=A0A250JK64_9BACT|nr:2-dehydropantoate 2-reductase N-terminal domain-containing protein [Cystobacter fuscus]ATB44018.1 2-dehydropantoate 2-reductase [Cystobacter fuscus]
MPQRIAVLGAGAIGTAFAYQLAQAGHAVTVVARGVRLARLRSDDGIVLVDGRRAAITLATTLPPTEDFDLVLVTVLSPQVPAVLPDLVASAARRVMFMFNTFESIAPLRDAVGADRFTFGFPGGVFSLIKDGRIEHQVRPGTTVIAAEDAALFSAAGIPTVTTPDMHAWLRSHAALVVGLMSVGCRAVATGRGITWAEARTAALATRQAYDLVRDLGHPILPSSLRVASALPRVLWALTFWLGSRAKILRDLGALGPQESRMLIDQMVAAAPPTKALDALRAIRL